MSRTRSLNGLHIINIDATAFKASEKAYSEYLRLYKKAEKDTFALCQEVAGLCRRTAKIAEGDAENSEMCSELEREAELIERAPGATEKKETAREYREKVEQCCEIVNACRAIMENRDGASAASIEKELASAMKKALLLKETDFKETTLIPLNDLPQSVRKWKKDRLAKKCFNENLAHSSAAISRAAVDGEGETVNDVS